mgnify:CR=1 FL=1
MDLRPNRIRQLSRLGSKYELFSLERFENKKRYAIVALYLYELSQNLIDKTIEINVLLSRGCKQQEVLQKQNGKSFNEKDRALCRYWRYINNGKGITLYIFVSDQFSTFYTNVINTNDKDAVLVIDGLLYHETDSDIEVHYTDTTGYTEYLFGLSHLLDFRFAPRIRDISEFKLYCAGTASEYPKIESILIFLDFITILFLC